MNTLAITEKAVFSIDMLRDDCKVIERRGAGIKDIKTALSKLHAVLKTMPPSSTDTIKDLTKTRESRGRL